MNPKRKKVILLIVDGLGIAAPTDGNAVTLAETPNLDKLWPTNPHGNLYATGNHVGRLEIEVGDSEFGHKTIGAGKVVLGPHLRISNAIKSNTFQENPALLDFLSNIKNSNQLIHIVSELSNNSLDVEMSHLYTLLDTIKKIAPTSEVLIHAVLSDTNFEDCIDVLEDVESYCNRISKGKIATISGIEFAFDTKRRWKYTKYFYDLLTTPIQKEYLVPSWKEYLLQSKEANYSPNSLEPRAISIFKEGAIIAEDNDGIIFPNINSRNLTQLCRAFTDAQFIGWERTKKEIALLSFVEIPETPIPVAFPEEKVEETLGSYISKNGLKQLRIAEVEKFVHITKYLNGSVSHSEDEDWIELEGLAKTINTDPAKNYRDLLKLLTKHINEYDFIAINIGILDIAAHSGDIELTIKAMEIIDDTIGKIATLISKEEGALVITSDHGNAEIMFNLEDGEINKNHTTSQVPFIVIDDDLGSLELPVGTLADVAPTICSLLKLGVPLDMRGVDLLHSNS